MEKNTTKKNEKIIFRVLLNLNLKILDLKSQTPKMQNNTRFKFVIRLPKIKLIGKKANIRFINKIELILIFFSFNII